MNDQDFVELAGRTEAVARLTLTLVAALEDADLIDGPRFSDQLRRQLKAIDSAPAHLHIAQRTLGELADALDDARTHRRSRGAPAGSLGH